MWAIAGALLSASAQEVAGAISLPLEPTAANDPMAVFLLQKAQHCGLGYVSGAPSLTYKVRARFEVIAPDGGVMDRGKYEQIIRDGAHSKTTYESTGFTQSWYQNGGPARVTGSRAGMPPEPYIQIVLALYSPMGIEPELRRGLMQDRRTAIQSEMREIAGNPVRCYELRNTRQGPDRGPWAAYCFNTEPALVQFTFGARPSGIATVNRMIEFQGRQVPAEVETKRKGLPGIRLHVESIEPINNSDEASLLAPPEAVTPDPIVIRSITGSSSIPSKVEIGSGDTASAKLPWQERRAKFWKTVKGANTRDPDATRDFKAILTQFETQPFSRNPVENMDLLGVFYAPKDEVEQTLKVVSANAALGWYDALRFGSESGRAEILHNEKFFGSAYLLSGVKTTDRFNDFMKEHPDLAKKSVISGLSFAEAERKNPHYDAHWPTAYGLERIICAQGGSCQRPKELPPDQWDKAWEEAKKQVTAYYESDSSTHSKSELPPTPPK